MDKFSFKNGDTLRFGAIALEIVDMTVTVQPATPGLPKVLVDLLVSEDGARTERQTLDLTALVIWLRDEKLGAGK